MFVDVQRGHARCTWKLRCKRSLSCDAKARTSAPEGFVYTKVTRHCVGGGSGPSASGEPRGRNHRATTSRWTVVVRQCLGMRHGRRRMYFQSQLNFLPRCGPDMHDDCQSGVDGRHRDADVDADTNFDVLQVNGAAHSGWDAVTTCLQGTVPVGVLEWTSHFTVQNSWWNICRVPTSTQLLGSWVVRGASQIHTFQQSTVPTRFVKCTLDQLGVATSTFTRLTRRLMRRRSSLKVFITIGH